MSMKSKLEVIASLMQELMGEMEPSASDFDERLGRAKPEMEMEMPMEDEGMGDIKAIKIEGELPMEEDDMMIEEEEEDDSNLSPLQRLKKLGSK